MSLFLRIVVLSVLLAAAVGCGTAREAETQSAPRSCGIDGLNATLNASTTLTLALDADGDARPRVTARWVKDPHTSIALPSGFDPIAKKEISILPAASPGDIDLSVHFVLDNLTGDVLHAILAAPGKMELTVDFTTAKGSADVCTVDVGLLPPSL